MLKDNKNRKVLAVTCGHKTFGIKWLFEHPATHQPFATVDTNAAHSPKRFIPQERCKQYPQKKFALIILDKMNTVIKYLVILFLLNVYLDSSGQNKPAARDTFNWKAYYSNSFVVIDSINYGTLRGNWIASSTTTFADYVIGSSSIGKNSGVLEIKGDKYRDTNAGPFYTFHFYKNMIVFNRETCFDTAYINKINKKELVISFKRDTNYIQYHYYK